jgi:GrxC family glutaredoxin
MNNSPVVMYGRAGCSYCRRARELLASKGVAYTEIDVTHVPGARAEMEQRSGRDTVPQIFIGEQHLGGYDDTAALDATGELDRILESGQRG